MTRILLLILSFILLSLEAEEDRLLIKPPEGWELAKSDQLSKKIKLMAIGKGKSFFPPSIHLGVEPYSGDVRDYLSMMKDVNRRFGDRMTVVDSIQTPAGSGPLVQVQTKNAYGEVTLLHFFLIRERVLFILTGASLKQESGALYRTFLETLKTLSFAPTLFDEIPKEQEGKLRSQLELVYRGGSLPDFESWLKSEFKEMPSSWHEKLRIHIQNVLSYTYE